MQPADARSPSSSGSSPVSDLGKSTPHDRHKSITEVDLGVSEPEGKGKGRSDSK